MPRMHCIPVFFVRRTICWNLKLISLESSKGMRAGISVLHTDRIRYLIYRNTEEMWPAAFQAEILEDWLSIPTVISPLKPPGNFMCLKFYTSTKYKYCIRTYLCVSYDVQNKEIIFTVSLCILSHSIFSVPNNAQYIHFQKTKLSTLKYTTIVPTWFETIKTIIRELIHFALLCY
jgi:hypothetical protein